MVWKFLQIESGDGRLLKWFNAKLPENLRNALPTVFAPNKKVETFRDLFSLLIKGSAKVGLLWMLLSESTTREELITGVSDWPD